jgi:hypothetical protein
MRDDSLLAQLEGTRPYHLYHPRIFAHPGPAVVVGCLNWDPYCHDMRRRGKRLIGVDPQTTVTLPGVEHVPAVITPFRGEIDLHGEGGGASLLWYHTPKIGRVLSITMEDLLKRTGPDIAGMQMNAEGAEGFVLLCMKRPYCDQMTIAFHDRPGLDPFLPSARDALLAHMDQWYDYTQIEASNDWWFFLRREGVR